MSSNKVNALLIEDDKESANLVTTANEMAKASFVFNFVTNGLEALDYLYQQGDHKNASRPDVIFLDMNLPILGGRDVLLGIGRNPSLQTIPVILLTNTSSHEGIKREFGLTDYCCYTKPDRFKGYIELMKRLDRLYHEGKLSRVNFATDVV